LPTIRLPNNWRPRDYQRPAWDYLERGGKHAEMVWHRRAGKDEVCLHRAACAAMERVAGYWHMLPEYGQARKAIWDAINPRTGKRRIDEAFPREIRRNTRNHEMHIEFINGSSWQVVGSDNFNSLVGSSPAGIVYSEWALANPAARAYLRPIVFENNGWQLFISTARGRNHAYKTLQAARNEPGAFAQVLSAIDTGVFTEEQLAKELRDYKADFGDEYGAAKFEQEYLCSFDAANLGSILAPALGRAEKAGLINDEVEFDERGAPMQIFADIGRRDTAAWWFWQPRLGGYAIFDHDSGWGIDAEVWTDRLHAKIAEYHLDGGREALGKIWLPHDARAKTFAAKHSAVEIFIKAFGADHVAITPDSKVADRVNAARVMVAKCEYAATKCHDGLEALRAWSYKYDDERKDFDKEPLHDWASHDGDAYSYGCLVMRLVEPEVPKPEPRFHIRGESGRIVTETLDELWKSAPGKDWRI
jgi:phage terminase large subunit